MSLGIVGGEIPMAGIYAGVTFLSDKTLPLCD